jgi:hypothetical protein
VNVKDLSWKHVAIVAVVFLTVAVTGLMGHENAALIALGATILAGIGVIAANTATVKNQTNGNQSDQMQLMRQMHQQQVATNAYMAQLLATLPPGTVPAPAPPDTLTQPQTLAPPAV